MSKLPNKNNKSVCNMRAAQSTLPVVVTAVKINRLVLATMLSLMAMVVFMGILLMPSTDATQALASVQKSPVLSDVAMNPVVSAEVDALKSQLVGLVSGSIEGKLKLLEKSVRTGTVSMTDLKTIHALQNDLNVLKTYSKTGAGRLIVDKYRQPVTPLNNEAIVLADEVSQLKQLVYMLLSSCGLMFAAAAGVWGRKQYLLNSDNKDNDQQLFL